MKPTTRKEILEHILGIIKIPSTVSYVLENELGITSIGILINTNESALLEHNNIGLAHVTAIMLFTEWLKGLTYADRFRRKVGNTNVVLCWGVVVGCCCLFRFLEL